MPAALAEFLDPAGRGSEEAAGRDHADQRLLGPASPFQEPAGEVGARADPGDGRADRADSDAPVAIALSVTGVDTFLAWPAVLAAAGAVDVGGHRRVGERLR